LKALRMLALGEQLWRSAETAKPIFAG
jgi:hypothetical protein